ncbi:MAG: hypothetical protein AAFR01_03850 [Pseudomonadota bacterium]
MPGTVELDCDHRLLVLIDQHEVEMRLQGVSAKFAAVELVDIHNIRDAHLLMQLCAVPPDDLTDLLLNTVFAAVAESLGH